MKNNTKTILAAIAVAVLSSGGFAYAEDAKTPATTESHDQHHPEGQAKEKPKDAGMMGGGMMNNDMMGKMDMTQMMGMMNECMSMHKDGKMCDHEAMQKCQEKMGKGDCKKMMKQAKAKDNTKVKK